MGLAASQAKLLSITARLSDNELRSQSITAAKMALASQTSEASKNYINALDATEFIYRTYDDNGNSVYTALTGAQLTTYSPIKNQYGLINTKGQILVSELDAANYQDSADINEFLEKYGVDRIDTGETRTVVNPGYNEAYEEWYEGWKEWKAQEPDKYIVTKVKDEWQELITPAWTERVHDSDIWKAVMQTGCISGSLGNTDCYMHVMASLVGPGTHTTTNGNTYTVYSGKCEEHNQTWCWNTDQHPVSQDLINELKSKYPCGEEHDEYVDLKYGGTVYNVWCKDSDCDSGITVYQKIVDLLWEVHDDYTIGNSYGGSAVAEHIAQFWHIVEFDLDEATIVEHPDEYEIHPAEYEKQENPGYEEWLEQEPEPLDVPATIDETIYEYSDKDKAQWYVNLWHRMNGASDEKDGTITTSTTSTDVEVSSNGTTITTTTNTYTRNRWDILEDGLMNSQEWLKYALESGTISLERVNFTNPTEEGTGLKDATWTSIIYTNALDISEQTDETAIAKAEAEYEQKTRELENKDKQYDSILKLLDTEHTALQTEYDSVKSVISKNTDRTLKMYSA